MYSVDDKLIILLFSLGNGVDISIVSTVSSKVSFGPFCFVNSFTTTGDKTLPGIIVLQELSLRLSIFQFRSVSINSL